MVERRRQRSDSMQHLFNEIPFAVELLETFTNDESVYKRLNPFAYNEEVAELEEQLKKEFWRVINDNLTERQREVVSLIAQGYTQQEVAKKIGVNQSSIVKAINGNTSYDINNKHSYGGIKKKLRKIIETDQRIIEVLQRIADLRGENWL